MDIIQSQITLKVKVEIIKVPEPIQSYEPIVQKAHKYRLLRLACVDIWLDGIRGRFQFLIHYLAENVVV
jgi:hypothetical protein